LDVDWQLLLTGITIVILIIRHLIQIRRDFYEKRQKTGYNGLHKRKYSQRIF